MRTKNKIALITGVTGQDGMYLSELLLSKGYVVHGVKRRSSLFNTQRIDHLYQDPHTSNRRFFLHYGDLTDATNITRIIQEVQPDEVYNLAAMSHVNVSFEMPAYVAKTDGLGTLHILEAIRLLGLTKKTKFYQASTSELFGKTKAMPQNEETPFYPRSPYGAAKLYAHWITINYREAYGMYACNGILFNHESPMRGETFVTRKITSAVAKIALGMQDTLYLGNLDATRDWGHAKDYVKAMWLLLQQETPDDFVIATGKSYSVRDFVQQSFQEIGVHLTFAGEGKEEKGIVQQIDTNTFTKVVGTPSLSLSEGQVVLLVDTNYYRPTEVDCLVGDATKARDKLSWVPTYSFTDIVKEMVCADLEVFKQNVRYTQKKIEK